MSFRVCRRRRKKQGVRTASPLIPSTFGRCARRSQPGDAQKPRGILRNAIQPHLEMQMRPGRAARRPDRRHRAGRAPRGRLRFTRPRTRGHNGKPVRCRGQSRRILPYWGWYPASTTLPLAAATTGVPVSAGKSMPSWNDCMPGERVDPVAEIRREPAVDDRRQRRHELAVGGVLRRAAPRGRRAGRCALPPGGSSFASSSENSSTDSDRDGSEDSAPPRPGAWPGCNDGNSCGLQARRPWPAARPARPAASSAPAARPDAAPSR